MCPFQYATAQASVCTEPPKYMLCHLAILVNERLDVPQAYGSHHALFFIKMRNYFTEPRERDMKLTGVPGSSCFGTSLGGLSPLPFLTHL